MEEESGVKGSTNGMTKQPKQILIVEDDAALSDAFTIVLTKEGYDVTAVYNGKEALEKVASMQPSLILLDLLMPVMGGKEFLEKYQNEHNIPVIVLSNLDTRDDIQEVLDLGATRYMLKAWASPKELIKLVDETLE
jgi:two-component system response regulator